MAHQANEEYPTSSSIVGAGAAPNVDFGISTQLSTGNTGRTASETRLRNIALLTCIKT
jgi:hypothetical protein